MTDVISFILLGALVVSTYVSVKYYREYKTYKKQYYYAINPPLPPPRGEATRVARETYDVIRVSILERDHYKCQECGFFKYLEVHHILPRSQGGSNDPTNLITLCRRCHAKKHGHACCINKKRRHTARNRRRRFNRYLNSHRDEILTNPSFHVIIPEDSPEMIQRRQRHLEKWEQNQLNQLPTRKM